MTLIVDIETVMTEAAAAMPYPKAERAAPSNYKDPEKIEAWFQRDEAEWRANRAKECALNPRLGRIVALGTDAGVAIAERERDEADILDNFWCSLPHLTPKVVTFNGAFDLRFIVLRSLVWGLDTTARASTIRSWFRRYTVDAHFDCRAVLTNWDSREPGTLTEWCQMFGIETHGDTGSGADVWAWYQAGQFDKIQAHCADDIRMTKALYQRIAPAFQ